MDNIHSGKIKGRTIKVEKVKIIKVGEAELEFIGIPAGSFQMGSNDRSDTRPMASNYGE
jgi:hypothetical protein